MITSKASRVSMHKETSCIEMMNLTRKYGVTTFISSVPRIFFSTSFHRLSEYA